jgi:hypothetical protein
MPFAFDDVSIGGQLQCGSKDSTTTLRTYGSGYVEGPLHVGEDDIGAPIPTEYGTITASETTNADCLTPPFYSLFVKTFARIKSFLKVDTLITVENIKARVIFTDILLANRKNFIVNHPLKPDKHLIHACLEGPENGVYFRGKLEGKNVINIPDYWHGLVDFETITVSLTPFKTYQELFVDKINWGQQIIVKNNSASPINCYYTIYAERNDIEKLVLEVDK